MNRRRMTDEEKYVSQQFDYYDPMPPDSGYPSGISSNDSHFTNGDIEAVELPPLEEKEWDEADRLRRLAEKLKKHRKQQEQIDNEICEDITAVLESR